MSRSVCTIETLDNQVHFPRKAVIDCCSLLLAIVCVQAASATDKIYWTDLLGSKVERADSNGSNPESIVVAGTETQPFMYIDADTAGKIYWVEVFTGIRRAELDGSNEQEIVPLGGSNSPLGIAVDASNSKVYWSNPGLNKIQRADLDGTNVQDVITTVGKPVAIALDSDQSKLYWSEESLALADDGFIRRSDLDGTNEEELRNLGQAQANGISLDLSNQNIYWSESVGDDATIWRSALDGVGPTQIISSGLSETGEIQVDAAGMKLYWSQPDEAKIQRSDLNGSNIVDIYTGTIGTDTPVGLALVTIGGGGLDCDFDNGSTCNLADLDLMYARGDLGSGVSVGAGDSMDLDNNESLNNNDITEWLSQAATANSFSGPYLRGDSDFDRDVDITDFNVLAVNFGQTDAEWMDGNFDGDNDVDITDFNYIAANFAAAGYDGGAMNSVPEPSALLLLSFGLATLYWFRFRQ